MNHYEVMGLARDADDEEIKKAYRQLAKKNHPDRNPGDPQAEERFKTIQNAYEVLSDPGKKANYDLGLPRPRVESKPKTKEDFERERAERDRKFNKVSTPEELRAVTCTYFGGPDTGRNVLAHLKLTPQEMQHGCVKTVGIKKRDLCKMCVGDGECMRPCDKCPRLPPGGLVYCDKCDSTGIMQAKCPLCGGEGVKNWYVQDVKVVVSPGVQPGHTVTVLGEGEVAPMKPPGYVRVVVV